MDLSGTLNFCRILPIVTFMRPAVRSDDSVEMGSRLSRLRVPAGPAIEVPASVRVPAPAPPPALAVPKPEKRQPAVVAAKPKNVILAVKHPAPTKPRSRIGLAVATALAGTVALVCTHARYQSGSPADSVDTLINPLPVTGTPDAQPAARTDEAKALERLTQALTPLPPGSAPAVLREANRWLAHAGAPACTMESAAGETALLVGPGRIGLRGTGTGPLTEALDRCAEAVEQTLGVGRNNRLK